MYQYWLILLTLIIAILYNVDLTNSEACGNMDTQPECEALGGCYWSVDHCACASNVTMDVVFALDSSGSIGASDFEVELEWTAQMIESELPPDARICFIRFATNSDVLLTLVESEQYTTEELVNFALDIQYTAGYTDTVAALEDTIEQFDAESSDEISKVLILITDGNPNAADGDNDVCRYSSELKSRDIETIIIGVGDGWDPDKVDCLVTDDDYIIAVEDYSYDQVEDILSGITEVTCPVTYDLVISEVQVETVSSTEGSRFVEFYNSGTSVPLKDVQLSGVFQGIVTTDESLVLQQGQYLVLYDQDVADDPSCADCACTLDANDRCVDAIYIGCCGGGACDCYYAGGTSMTNENWNVALIDGTVDEIIDDVVYDPATWTSILTGYTYELKYIGYDNDVGANWAQSCNTRGTPGYEPITNCAYTCTPDQCQLNNATNAYCYDNACVCVDTSYYTSGTTCVTVPPPGECWAYWLKNDTTQAKWVKFVWEEAQTDDAKRYLLNYYTKNSGSDTDAIETSSRVKEVSDYQYSRGSDVIAGWVQTKIDTSLSESVDCWPVTQAPSPAPTPRPTTKDPTQEPTKAPTWDSPRLYVGGDICEVDRCECADSSWECEGEDIYKEFAASENKQFITVKKWPGDYPELVTVKWGIEYLGDYDYEQFEDGEDDDDANDSRRRLLTQAHANSIIAAHRNALNEVSNLKADVQVVGHVDTETETKRRMQVTLTTTFMPFDTTDDGGDDGGNSGSDIGIEPTVGHIRFNGTSEERIAFTIYEQDIGKDENQYRLYHMNLTKCNTTDVHDCFLVYPRDIYMVVDITGGESLTTNTKEEEMPRWLWWVIGALILFLFLLAWLVYKYWWQQKRTKAELLETEDELDMALEENELGFGHDLGVGDVEFNPMATGVPGQSKAPDVVGQEMAQRHQDAQNDKADVPVAPFQFKEEFGGNQGKVRQGGNDLTRPLLDDN